MPELLKRPVDPEREEGDDDAQDHAFLGREFMTWLVYQAARGEATFEDDAGEMVFAFGGRVRLAGAAGDVADAVLKGRSPAGSVELLSAIGAGRTLREAELRVTRGATRHAKDEREFRFTLVGETLDFKGVKLPARLKDDEDDRLGERMALLEELESCVQAAFQAFLRERLRPGWQRSTVPDMRAWLGEGLEIAGE
jgi:hypothetical protein